MYRISVASVHMYVSLKPATTNINRNKQITV